MFVELDFLLHLHMTHVCPERSTSTICLLSTSRGLRPLLRPVRDPVLLGGRSGFMQVVNDPRPDWSSCHITSLCYVFNHYVIKDRQQ